MEFNEAGIQAKTHPSSADWINLSGSPNAYTLANGQLQMHLFKPADTQQANSPQGPYNLAAGMGSTFNSSYKMHYGTAEITMQCIGVGGVVNAFIVSMETMAPDNADEIDWEMVGGDVQHGQSNFFWNNDHLYGVNSQTHSVPGGPINTTSYTFVNRADTLTNGVYMYPSHPSYIQFGVWDSSTSPTTTQWANGPIDWNSQPS
ncbi:1459_t:CDS:2, partial [Acaulospora colombiana]